MVVGIAYLVCRLLKAFKKAKNSEDKRKNFPYCERTIVTAWTGNWTPGEGGEWLSQEEQVQEIHLYFPRDWKGWTLDWSLPGLI